ncbi:MAG: glutamate formiminotransferase, partial [Acidimicrobiia bacterium]
MVLASRATVQVSMNLVDLDAISLERACVEVRRLAEDATVAVERVELVGLVPASEIARSSADFLTWSGVGAHDTIEARLSAQ